MSKESLEVNVEIGLCDLKNIKNSEQALKEFKMLCYNYQDKWDKTTFDYFIGCVSIIDNEIKETTNLLEEINNERIMLSGLNEKYKKDLERKEKLEKALEIITRVLQLNVNWAKRLLEMGYLTQEEYDLLKEVLENE